MTQYEDVSKEGLRKTVFLEKNPFPDFHNFQWWFRRSQNEARIKNVPFFAFAPIDCAVSITATCMLLRNEEEEFSFRWGEGGDLLGSKKWSFFSFFRMTFFAPTPLDQGVHTVRGYMQKGGLGLVARRGKGKRKKRGEGRGLKTPP